MKKQLLFLAMSTLSSQLIAMELTDLKSKDGKENEKTPLLSYHNIKKYNEQDEHHRNPTSTVDSIRPNIQMGDTLQLNNYQKTWPFSLCLQRYDDTTCNSKRECLLAWGTFGVGSLFCKGLISSILCCTGSTCKDSCSLVWIGTGNCDTGCDCFGTIWQSMTTGMIIASCLIAGCAQLPCYSKKNCTLCCCKKRGSPTNDNQNYDDNDI